MSFTSNSNHQDPPKRNESRGPCLGEGEHPETQQGDSIGWVNENTSQADLVEGIFFSSMQHLQDESVLLHGGFLK